MDLNNIITTIESIDDIADRCSAYGEVIAHMKNLKNIWVVNDTGVNWKNEINHKIFNTLTTEINTGISELKEMIRLNVDVNKLNKE